MKVKLVLLSTAIKPNEFKLTLPAKIGRGREASLRLVHGQISRLHCEIYEENGQLMVRDLASLNGTLVDDQRLDDPCPLVSGCKLTVGSVDFQVVVGDGAGGVAPPQRTAAATPPAGDEQTAQPAEPATAAAIKEDAQLEMTLAGEPAAEAEELDVAWLFADDDEPPKPQTVATTPATTVPPDQQPAAKAAQAPLAPTPQPAQAAEKPLAVGQLEPASPAADADSGVTTMWTPPAASPAKQPLAAAPFVMPLAPKSSPSPAQPAAPATASPAAPAKPAAEEPQFQVGPDPTDAEPAGAEPDPDLDAFFKSIM